MSIQLQQQQVPCNVFFTTMDHCNKAPKLFIKWITGIKTLHLHLLCEDLHKIHVVEDQQGVPIPIIPENLQKLLPLVKASLTIFSLLLKVGVCACGSKDW
jgi:hypothetical protein